MRQRGTMFAIAALTGLLVLACGAGEAKDLAEGKAVPEFHSRYDREDFNGIYSNATEEFRAATTKQSYDDFMKAVRRKLGKVKSSTRQNWNVHAGTGGTRIVLTYATEFERGSGTETFTFLKRKEGPKLLGYQINSTQLITN